MRIVVLGPPGAGKGTQAQFIAQHVGVPKISTGDIFRDNIRGGTPLGRKAKEFLDAGKLVPDELTINIVRDRLSQPDVAEGFLLDGFPRNVAQAEELDRILADCGVAPTAGSSAYLDIALDFEIDDAEVIKRISGRRQCTGDPVHVYHVDYSPSATGEACEVDGTTLIQRSDDREDVVRHRLDVYAQETAPIIGFYREQGVLVTIEATGKVEDITRRALDGIRDKAGGVPQSSAGASAKARLLAGLRNDDPSIEDLLNVASDVETLAELIAAKGTEPPLAIALLGEWGAGKSSVMRQVEARVDSLVKLSRENPAETSFVSVVRQVRFNAWHYSDDHLWLGLTENLFRALAANTGNSERGESGARLSADQLGALKEKRDARRKEIERVDEALRDASSRDATIGPVNITRPDTRARAAVSLLPHVWRDVRRNLGFLVVWLAVSSVAIGIWITYHDWLVRTAAALVALAAPVRALLRTARLWWQKNDSLATRSIDELGRWRKVQCLELDRLNAQLIELDAVERLSKFIAERSDPGSYAGYRGIMGQVHADLSALTANLRTANEQWTSSAEHEDMPLQDPPLQRIVLYIDDLDRCTPERVVEVLAAVHLMLALPLFIVVVAVDPRWLLGALHHHYHELFDSNADPPGYEPLEYLVSPLDYLDKIFQIPFAIRPMEPGAAGSYIATLLAAHGPAHASVVNTEYSTAVGIPTTDDDLGSVLPAVPEISTAPPTAQPNLNPAGLTVHRDESRFMSQLGPLLSTPRAAKKLVNLYRLTRIRVDDTDLDEFLASGDYKIVQILLAILVGNPKESRVVYGSLLNARTDGSVSEVVDSLPQSPYRTRIAETLGPMLATGELSSNVDVYRHWCRELARYSFHTRSIASSGGS